MSSNKKSFKLHIQIAERALLFQEETRRIRPLNFSFLQFYDFLLLLIDKTQAPFTLAGCDICKNWFSSSHKRLQNTDKQYHKPVQCVLMSRSQEWAPVPTLRKWWRNTNGFVAGVSVTRVQAVLPPTSHYYSEYPGYPDRNSYHCFTRVLSPTDHWHLYVVWSIDFHCNINNNCNDLYGILHQMSTSKLAHPQIRKMGTSQ